MADGKPLFREAEEHLASLGSRRNGERYDPDSYIMGFLDGVMWQREQKQRIAIAVDAVNLKSVTVDVEPVEVDQRP